tara:strand:- start:291 stop:458 length:168 start_codon:yes stop_codon:yes gene_type:complete
MIKTYSDDNGSELQILNSLRIGYNTIKNEDDKAIMFHVGFLNPGITIMLNWRRNG